jgi:deoxyribonuclease-4
MELEFVRGVRMTPATAGLIASTAATTGVKLSAHAPYYINFNAHEAEKVKASQQRLIQTVRVGAACGITSAVFHPGFYLGDSPETTYSNVRKHLAAVIADLDDLKGKVWLRPEVMGRSGQFGTLEDVLNLCAELEGLAPCIDFAHWHARTGQYNSYEDFAGVLRHVEKKLGRSALGNMHMHISGIEYAGSGEIRHLNLKESDLQYAALLRALKDFNAQGTVICESPNLESDALLLQKTYQGL